MGKGKGDYGGRCGRRRVEKGIKKKEVGELVRKGEGKGT